MEEIVLNYDHIIEDLSSAIVQKQVLGSIVNILVMRHDCKFQRMISFEVPEIDCSIGDLLNKVSNLYHL